VSKSKGWDMTSLHSLESGAEWMRKQAGDALLVLVVRGEDVAFAVHADVKPADAVDVVQIVMPGAMATLNERRLEAYARAMAKKLGAMKGVQ